MAPRADALVCPTFGQLGRGEAARVQPALAEMPLQELCPVFCLRWKDLLTSGAGPRGHILEDSFKSSILLVPKGGSNPMTARAADFESTTGYFGFPAYTVIGGGFQVLSGTPFLNTSAAFQA